MMQRVGGLACGRVCGIRYQGIRSDFKVKKVSLLQLKYQIQSQRDFFSVRSKPLTLYERVRDGFMLGGLVLGLVLGTAYYYDSRSAIHTHLINPLMRYFMDPEAAHRLSIVASKYGLAPYEVKEVVGAERLKTKVWGLEVDNPIGLAAGYDKHGEAVDAMLELGFGLVEIGSVTPQPQEGNPLPRYFRLPEDKAVINRYGFNSDGHEAVEIRLKNRLWKHIKALNWEKEAREGPNGFQMPATKSCYPGKLLGINLGKNKSSALDSPQDYLDGVLALGPYGDYLVINISSPNTPGLRELQKVDYFKSLISKVQEARDLLPVPRPPLLVKIAPDVTDAELKDIATAATDLKLDGLIVSNTTVSRPASLKSGLSQPKTVAEAGGLSGQPLKPLALQTVNKIYKLTQGQIPIVGCGGISSGQDAIDFAKAGASLVQFYTHLGYRGPIAIHEIKNEVADYLAKNNLTWSQLVGSNHR